MGLFILALIPVIALLVIVYLNDKKEKEPFGLLAGLFFAGMGTVITAMIAEGIGMAVLNLFIPSTSPLNAVILAVFIVGPAEELGKFAVLRLITWKNKNFDYSYDAIVYAIFVSLGFAALENVGYVFMYGLGTAILRMFSAVPGHACYAVFMGYFYSKAKAAQLTNKKDKHALFIALSIIVPTVLHGIYDAIIMGGRQSNNNIITGLSALLWIGYVIILFAVCIILVIYSSKHDYRIVTVEEKVQTIYRPQVMGTWKCMCGAENTLNFCTQCGNSRPADGPWNCPKCGTLSYFKFCGNCGCHRT